MQKKINLERKKISNRYQFKQNINNKFGINIRLKDLYLKSKIRNQLNDQIDIDDVLQNNIIQIDFQKSIRSYRGVRHKARLPVRGQRTHTNAKTRKKKKFS